jgi:hypothetical protein
MTQHIPFTDNVTDLSNEDGYQFEFRCERCGNGFRSAFRHDPRSTGQKLARGLSGFFGGPIAQVGYMADRLLDRGTNSPAKDDALQAATGDIGQCVRCSPVVVEELARLQADARRTQMQQRLESIDLVGGIPLAQQAHPRCPSCGAQTGGGRFCSDCGASLVTARSCSGCTADVALGARFCAVCGAAVSS